MGKSVYIIVAFLILKIYCIAAEQESSESDRILSRRRRYLIFPEGSSLQLGKICVFFENIFATCQVPKIIVRELGLFVAL